MMISLAALLLAAGFQAQAQSLSGVGLQGVDFRHGFLHQGVGLGKLGDEYGGDNGTLSDSALDYFHTHEAFGWFKNVDTESDPAKVKWSRFLTDSRYAAEGLGIFEGAYTVNKGMFNAPSREALYIRIHQLAFGSAWQYDYETFVAWDAVNLPE